ncbi:MAG TPA: PAS domain S-box protein, partial [Verrucomicrobiae bacterium]
MSFKFQSSLRLRILITIVTAAGLTCLLFSVMIVYFQSQQLGPRAEQVLEPYAQIIQQSMESLVDFNDQGTAGERLQALEINPQIVQAELVVAQTNVFARYPARAEPLRLTNAPGVYLHGAYADLVHEFETGGSGKPVRLVLRMSLSQLQARNRQTVILLALASFATLLVAVFAQLLVMRRWVVAPLQSLTHSVDKLRQDPNYRVRLAESGEDEIAVLGRNFNLLLSQVEFRENSLRVLNNFQRAILDNAAYAIISTDARGNITSFNPAAEKLLGYQAAELIGKSTPEIFHDAAEVRARAEELSRQLGQPVAANFEAFVALARLRQLEEREWTYIRKDGRHLPVMLSVTALRNEQDEVVGFLGMATDISERKLSIRELADRERRLQRAFAATTDSIWEWNVLTNETYYSPRWYEILGYADRALPMNIETFRTLCHPEDFPGTMAATQKVVEGLQEKYTVEFRMLCRDGSWLWVEGRGAVAERDAAGRAVLLSGTNADISQRRKILQVVQEREEKYRMLFENMTTGFALQEVVCDEHGQPVDYRFLEINPAFGQLTGVDPGRLVGRTVREVLPGTEEYWIKTFGKVAMTGEPISYQNYSRELGRHYDTWAFSPKRGQFAVVFSDITERVKYEEESREKNSLLEATLEATADGILVVSGEGTVTSYNRRFTGLWHLPEEVIQAKSADLIRTYLEKQLNTSTVNNLRRMQFNDTSKYETYDVLDLSDGRVVERYSRPQYVAGQVVGRVWCFRDVTHARQAEAALRENEYKFKTLFETANDAILLIHDNVFVDCNQKAEQTFGCKREKIIGVSPLVFSPARQADGQVSDNIYLEKMAAVHEGHPQFFEWIHCRVDGTPFNAEVSLNRLELRGKIFIQAIVRDITSRKQAEAARREAEDLYRTLVNTSPDGIAVLGMDGRIQFASPR